MDQLERVMVKEFALDGDHGKDADGKPITASQAAHDYVQAVVNPDKHHHSRYGVLGFLHAEFQGKISANCEKVVTAAYAAAGIKTAA